MHNKRFFAPPLTDLKDTMTETILATPPDAIFHVNTQSATANSALTRAIQSAHGGRQPMDFEDVRLWTAEHKPHDLQHVNVFLNTWGYGPAHLLSLSSDAPDKNTPAPRAFASLLEWYDAAFPKSRRGLHPRLDLGVSLDRYKKIREGVRRSILGCMGAYEQRAERNALRDGWADVLALLQPLTEHEGPLDKRSFSLLKTFADIARRASLEPWQLTADMFDVLDEVFVTSAERELTRRAIRTLNQWSGIVDFNDLLPATPIPPLPARRLADRHQHEQDPQHRHPGDDRFLPGRAALSCQAAALLPTGSRYRL